VSPLAAAGAALVAALVGRTAGWLTAPGTAWAAVIGTAVLVGAGLRGGALLALFFLSGSLLTRRNEGGVTRSGVQRGSGQVLANGWVAAVGGLLVPAAPGVGHALLAGGLAAAQADTWATELGARSARPPVLITSGMPVSPGTSGGVTFVGTMGGVVGAAVLAGMAMLVGVPARVAISAGVGGVFGMVLDSVLGATVQAGFRCAACGRLSESANPGCDHGAPMPTGWGWVSNDVVNGVATACGAVVSVALFLGIR